MKVLVCHNYYKNTTGEDLVISTDIQILRENGVNVIVYKRSNKETDAYNFADKIRFFPNTVYSIRTVKEVTGLVKSEHPEVALIQNVFPLISPSVYYTLKRLDIPIVQLIYNYRFLCANATLYKHGRICEKCAKGNHFNAFLYRCYRESPALSALYACTLAAHRHVGDLSKMISAYVTPDLFLQGKLVEGGFPKERMFSLLNPFDVTRYTARYEHEGYFVYFGRIIQEKGIFTLLKAMKGISKSKLVIIGGGEAEGKAREVVRLEGLSNVSFMGPKYGEDLIALLGGALAIIVPSEWYDNSPLVVHQAFALGKPVIASRIDGIPEIVEERVSGLLFEPGDSVDLSEKMSILEENELLRQDLGRNARRRAEMSFTPKNRFQELTRVMNYARMNRV